MRNIINYLAYVPKSFVLFMGVGVLTLSAVAGPVANYANVAAAEDDQVRLEADTKVKRLNLEDGTSTDYKDEVSAKVDDVVQVQVWYHNMENADGPAAKNLNVGIDVPNAQGENQTITSTVNADNATAQTTSADVNLSLDNAHLEYIAYGEGVGDQDGGAKWRHNKGAEDGKEECITGNEQTDVPEACYVTESLGEAGDKIVNGGLKIEDEFQPSFEFESTITVLARVKANAVKVNKYVRNADKNPDGDWKLENEADPSDTLEYMIRFENKGNKTLNDVMIGDNLPKYTSYVEGSTKLLTTGGEGWQDIENDNVTRGGINVGNYMPGSVGYVRLKADLDPVNVYEECGTYTVKNVGVVRPADMNEFYNTAHTDVEIDCEPEPEEEFAKCVDLTASVAQGEPGLEVDFEAEFESQELDVEGFTINYGDGGTEQVTGTSASHNYQEAGEYEARVTQVITDDGAQKVEHNDCAVTITVEEEPEPEEPEEPGKDKPEELAAAGPLGPLMGLFASGALGVGARGWLMSRRNLKASLRN